ncbi:MAG: D-2-hydroxyacid dehydrogenase [Bacteroidetes bacterium]|nr:MAG: D-2-hydroxyacid dehydrogenase [Bacteroidota bacterium]
MPTITVLDGYTLNPGDLSWAPLHELGDCHIYDRTAEHESLDRSTDADIILVNKHPITAELLARLPKLRYIGVMATGYNNIDLEAARRQGIAVTNVAGYSTPSVVQHVFALLLELLNRTADHHHSVQRGEWSAQADFSYTLQPIPELASLTLGIYGFGRIGQAVARVALAFGMQVLAHHKHPQRDAMEGVTFVDLAQLFSRSNVISLHAPLTAHNAKVVNAARLTSMPHPAYLINTGRGGLVDEQALRHALQTQQIQGAGLDVLSSEPPPAEHPLLGIDNCIITPHIAWASVAARQRLLDETVANIRAFLQGQRRNRID